MRREVHFISRSVVPILILVVFFVIYNHFLLDNSIERIRTALADVSQEDTWFASENASFLLQDLLVSEIGRSDVNLERVIVSDAFSKVMMSERLDSQKPDTEFLLQNLLSSYEKERSPVLRFVDQCNLWLKEQLYHIEQFWGYLFSASSIRKQIIRSGEEGQLKILKRAREFELNWEFDKAAQAYQLFLNRFPNYPKRDLIQLYLASVYLRSHEYGLAQEILSEIDLSKSSSHVTTLAKALHQKLSEMKKMAREKTQLAQEIEYLKKMPAQEGLEAASLPQRDAGGILGRLQERQSSGGGADLVSKLFNYGLLSLYLFDLQDAQNTFQELIELNPPPDVEKHVKWLQGWVALLQNNYVESRRLMRELLERYPQDKFGELSMFVLASIAEQTKQYETAIKDYQALVKKTASQDVSFLLTYRTGNVYLYGLKDVTKAQATFLDAKRFLASSFLSKSFDQNVLPSLISDMRQTAFQRFFQGDLPTAQKFFEDVLRLDDNDAWAHCGYGLALYMNGNIEQGLDEVKQCRSMKKDEYTNSAYAFLLEKEERWDEASVLYQEALGEKPDYVVALYNLGRIELQKSDLEKSLMHLKDAKKNAGNDSYYAPLISNNLGIVYWRRGDLLHAELEFLNALDFDSHFADAHFNLAQLYERIGKTELIKPHLDRVSEEDMTMTKNSIDRITL